MLAKADADPPDVVELDRAAVGMLQGSPNTGEALAQIDVESVGRLLDRAVARLGAEDGRGATDTRTFVWDVLDLVRRKAVLMRIPRESVEQWARRMLHAIETSHFTVGPLFRHRAATYGSKTLFEVPDGSRTHSLSWVEVEARVNALARGLVALGDDVAPVAILSENRLEMALLDLACLTSAIEDVVIPANSTEQDVGYILRHARVRTVVVSNREQLAKVRGTREGATSPLRVVIMDPGEGSMEGLLTLQDVLAGAAKVPDSEIVARGNAVRIDQRATVMYTSGTTGNPKGIQFSHRNVVFKRFARALALPEIGDEDVFLAYLPLFHTFGRYFEMLGSVFWGAKYCFLPDPSVEALIDGMRRRRPTIFISVPRKWIQLHEAVAQRVDLLNASNEEIRNVTQDITGGRLRWGLSAAGHLDTDVFKFFQRQGIELMSGFGMSEATGGITMTPPGRYKDNSLGEALPGIELALADDGELLIRGPYVMIGYLDPPDGQPSFDDDGWLHTGDLMQMDADGFIRLVDRKKEIYKNIKGETIAPQRIENLFREFESVGRAFLVGDHREYNTLLLYPNPAYEELDFTAMSPEDVREHFRSLVVSVNKFVAPFERVVDFAIINRDLEEKRGELTPKGTPRRKTVVDHFAAEIETLYHRASLKVGGTEIAVPNWFFQNLGLTAQDVRVTGDRIVIPPLGTRLTVRRLEDGEVQLGTHRYRCSESALNVGAVLATPRLWLGNAELVAFAPLESQARDRQGREQESITFCGFSGPPDPDAETRDRVADALRRTEWDLWDLHAAALLLAATDGEDASNALRLLERVVTHEEADLAEPARSLLARTADHGVGEVRHRGFQLLVPSEPVSRFRDTVSRFFAADPAVLDTETSQLLCERGLSDLKTETLLELAERACTVADAPEELAASLLRFHADYGAAHPLRFRRTRAFLVRMSLFGKSDEVRRRGAEARAILETGFRAWLGPTSKIAVDTETAQEYRWEDVVVFDDDVPEEHRRRLLSAIKNTQFLREAAFLFYRGTSLRLSDIPPGGVWIRQLGDRHGKAVYRITVQTRRQDTFEIAANVNRALAPDQVREEIDWLVVCGESAGREPVVEDFGGYLADEDMWSEEFIAGDTLDREMRRLERRQVEEGLRQLWPFFAWSALSAYVDFWERTGHRQEIAELSPGDMVVPTHDYHRGSRIVSLSVRRPHKSILNMLRSFKEEFVDPAEANHEDIAGVVGWNTVFSAVLEVLGEQRGLSLFRDALENDTSGSAELREALEEYIGGVQLRGFLPMRLFFAVKRYRRWAELNVDATPQARARTMQELYDTYGLDRLAMSYPEGRLRFFRETVFRDASPEIVQGLEELIVKVRRDELRNGELASEVAALQQRLTVSPDDEYFLARIPFAYLRPEDAVDFARSEMGAGAQSEIVVTLEDVDANPFRVRHALLPKEVERLHRLYVAAKLDVRFRPEHRYLVAINDREQIVGGIYYDIEEGGARAHLEKIVVSDGYRRKGVAGGLMNELFNRLKAAGVKRLTTGFFRPEYFYGYGFRIEKRYAGLVKVLDESEEEEGRLGKGGEG